jgi:hypothetical protein
MSNSASNWFSCSAPQQRNLVCAECRFEIDLSAFLDHHPGICPNCEIECAYLDWKENRKIQIIPENSPKVFAEMLYYLQTNFDELEYVELLACFQEIADAIK